MTIHHATLKKAEKAGIQLTEEEDIGKVRAFWPKRAVAVYGNSSSDALAQMQAAMAIADGDEYKIVTDVSDSRLVIVLRREDGHQLKGSPMPPVAAHKAIVLNGNAEWEDPTPFTATLSATEKENLDERVGESDDVVTGADDDDGVNSGDTGTAIERINGVAIDGAVAYSEGTPAGDCPYTSETEDDEEYANFERWNEEWDNAADAASEEEGKGGGSVVNEKYRAKYAELGHPTHCGDWLAELLNNLCLTKESTDLERFEAICAANGVDLSKYNRTTPGWQGRIRMTGRNLLAKRVYMAGGVIKTPVEGAEPEYRAPSNWMDEQRYKMPKAEQAKPIPEADNG